VGKLACRQVSDGTHPGLRARVNCRLGDKLLVADLGDQLLESRSRDIRRPVVLALQRGGEHQGSQFQLRRLGERLASREVHGVSARLLLQDIESHWDSPFGWDEE
jgi:hypothetical protein